MSKSNLITRQTASMALASAFVLLPAAMAQAQYTPVFYDGYDTSAGSQDVNFEYNNGTRQGGVLSPLTYAQNPVGADYHHQVTGTTLQLAGDPTFQYPMVSPNQNFKGSIFGSQVVGTKISFSLDLNTPLSAQYTAAGISLGASSQLVNLEGDASTHFAVKFVEDGAFGGGNFIQFYDGINLVNNSLPFTAGGAGAFGVDLLINDLADGNPWDGVGSTTIDLYVNNVFIAGYTKGGGGYTDNYLTLVGERGFSFGPGLTIVTHQFDNLLVYASPVPEPSTLALAGLGLASLVILRRRQPQA
jgi:hypothetical protein